MLRSYFTIAWRIITRNRLYALISTISLALGICGCIVIWLVAGYELSFDKFHPNGARIYRVGGGGKTSPDKDHEVLPPIPEVIRRSIPGLECVSTSFRFFQNRFTGVPNGDKPPTQFDAQIPGRDRPATIIADSNYFNIFQYQWLAGSPAASLSQPFRVVLTESRARLYFGPATPQSYIGKELIYQDSLHVFVSGIVRDWAGNTDFPYTDFVSFPTIAASFLKEVRHMDDWIPHGGMGKWYWPTCFVKLAKGTKPEQVEAQLRAIGRRVVLRETPTSKTFLQMQLQPLADIHFNSEYRGDGIRKAHLPTLYAMMAIAVFILLLGAVNFINLSTAQSLQRAKEIGVRKVMGGGRTSLMGQFLIETGIITFAAVVGAALLVNPAMRLFSDYVPDGVHFHPFSPFNLSFLVAITVITTLFAGFYPAKVLSGYAPVLTLKGGGVSKGGEKYWLRKALIVFQFTISLVFIVTSLLMGNQIRYMLKTDYGFTSDAVVTVSIANLLDSKERVRILAEQYRRLPGIVAVVREGNPPAGWGAFGTTLEYKGKNDIPLNADVDAGDENFIPFYGMHLVAGRNIRHSDSLLEWVINETAAKGLGFASPRDAIGKPLYWGQKPYPIVGVVADFHESSFKDPIRPAAIGNISSFEGDLGVRLASMGRDAAQVKATLEAMEKAFKELYPSDRFSYAFWDELIAEMYETEQKTAALIDAVMVLAITISCMGLFGLALFTARRKAAEISIRKVLGASMTDITAMLNRGFLVLVLLALVIASPIAWFLTNRWLQEFAYRPPFAWWVFPLAGAGAILIALLTVTVQSIRAAMANPIKHLRSE
ncbi:MAG TPA: ABC transporter permease [Puia sp.]|uniref:ABC transporter permease n=1 Tax=Puia sp. TaxID=2045100 RepID=UPI002B6D3509|nr:ABC transporter permease [Puia sp.]HVU97881.1 ABC transporter permease [Puia sp.]